MHLGGTLPVITFHHGNMPAANDDDFVILCSLKHIVCLTTMFELYYIMLFVDVFTFIMVLQCNCMFHVVECNANMEYYNHINQHAICSLYIIQLQW